MSSSHDPLFEDVASHLERRVCGIVCENHCVQPRKVLQQVLVLLSCYEDEEVRHLIEVAPELRE